MTAETLAAIWEAIITTYDEFAIGFSLEPEKVKDRSVDLELPRAFWAMPRVTVQWVAGTGAYDQTFEVNILFLGQTASDRTADTATGTHSDMAIAAQRCLERFIDLYVNGDTLFMGEVVNIERIGAGTLSPLIDEDTTQLTGVNLRIDVTVRAAECAAGYFDGIPSETADCDAATVTNSDDSYTRTVASGATLELPDVTHTDSDGAEVVLPAMTPFEATLCEGGGPCEDAEAVVKNSENTILETESIPSGGSADIFIADAALTLVNTASETIGTHQAPSGVASNVPVPDTVVQLQDVEGRDIGTSIAVPSGSDVKVEVPDATVTNSDDSYTRTVAPGATLELPDVTHTDSDGSPVTLPGMVAFVATPCAPGDDAHVLINQNPVIDLGPGETWDLHVEYPDGTPVGSWNAGAERWEIPECPACDPATAVLKNTDGTILDTEEIPSGGSEDIIAPDATAVLKNSEGTTLDTELIPSGVSEDVIAPDATVQLKDSAGTNIGTPVAVPSGVSQKITAPDGTIKTTDGVTTVGAVLSGASANLPQSVIKYKDAANADQVTSASDTEFASGTLRPATQIPRRELTRDGVGTGSYVTAADLIAGTVPDVTTERAIVASWAAGDDETIPIILPAEYQGQTFDYVSNTGTNGTITVSVDGASSYAAPPFTVGTLGVSFKRTTYAAAGSVLYEV